jgi:hypothetical protein
MAKWPAAMRAGRVPELVQEQHGLLHYQCPAMTTVNAARAVAVINSAVPYVFFHGYTSVMLL